MLESTKLGFALDADDRQSSDIMEHDPQFYYKLMYICFLLKRTGLSQILFSVPNFLGASVMFRKECYFFLFFFAASAFSRSTACL